MLPTKPTSDSEEITSTKHSKYTKKKKKTANQEITNSLKEQESKIKQHTKRI